MLFVFFFKKRKDKKRQEKKRKEKKKKRKRCNEMRNVKK